MYGPAAQPQRTYVKYSEKKASEKLRYYQNNSYVSKGNGRLEKSDSYSVNNSTDLKLLSGRDFNKSSVNNYDNSFYQNLQNDSVRFK